MLKLLKVGLVILLGCNISFGQLSVRVFNYRPTGEFGSVMKPLTSAEIGWQGHWGKHERGGGLRGVAALNILIMKPRMDTFPIYGVSTVNGLYPMTQTFQKSTFYQLFFGLDYAFITKEKLNVYIGADMIVGGGNFAYTVTGSPIKDESYSGGAIIVGVRFRAGVEYLPNEHIGLFANANRSFFYFVTDSYAVYWANDYGVGIRYFFKNDK